MSYYYELHVGKKLVGTANSLVEVYKYSKVIYTLGLIYQPQPLSRMRGHQMTDGLVLAYILFEVDGKLYIRPLKVTKKCQSLAIISTTPVQSVAATTFPQ